MYSPIVCSDVHASTFFPPLAPVKVPRPDNLHAHVQKYFKVLPEVLCCKGCTTLGANMMLLHHLQNL